MTDQDKAFEDFKRALLKVLQEHNAIIYVGYDDGSDMHGVTGEHMTVTLRPQEGPRKEFRLCDEWGIAPDDLVDGKEED